MADDSPGKVQALRAIFSEKNQPVMGILPQNGKISNRPWKNGFENGEEPPAAYKEKIIEQRTSQLLTKVLPFPAKKSENSESHKDSNGCTEKLLNRSPVKPSVGPKPTHLSSQQVRINSSKTESIISCEGLSKTQQETTQDTNDQNKDKSESFLKSQAKSKAVAETIASFMFSNNRNKKSPPLNTVPDASNITNGTDVLPVPQPRNIPQTRTIPQDSSDLVRLCRSHETKGDLESLCSNLINSDNYICKSNCKFRRKGLPSVEKLGPAPLKPSRPQHVVLPEKYRVSPIVPNVAKVQCSQPPSHPPPTIPVRTALQRPAYPCPPRPHTPPPLPPSVKPSMTLREEIEELYEDTLLSSESSKRPVSLIPEYTIEEEEAEELYNDADHFEENSSSFSSLPQKPKEPPPPCPSEYLQPNVLTITEELYQDADEVNEEFYEVMPCDEIPDEPDSPVYSNNKKEIEKLRREEDKKSRKEQKEKEKRDKEMEKLKKKFGLTGGEIPIDDGLVKSDSRGSRGGDLPVRRGETVLILRMEGNPSGRWLVKNEKGKIGYVELTNIEVDPLSVKSVMTIRRLSVISACEDLYCEARSEEEGIYEVTY